MAVLLTPPSPESLKKVSGIQLGTASCAIKRGSQVGQRQDLLIISMTEGSSVAGVFTQNRFCAAPVQVCQQHLKEQQQQQVLPKALIINTGNANAGTGEEGLKHAQLSCESLAKLLGTQPAAILPFSTGVILEALPIDRLIGGIPEALSNLKEDNWLAAAKAIMTTDTIPKAASRTVMLEGKEITLTGISKGAGMIRPNMATMLGFIATDAKIETARLNRLLKEATELSFNCITIDGDTSTNDSLVLMATGQSGVLVNDHNESTFKSALVELAQDLAQRIVRDGEGATKFIHIQVEKAKSIEEAKQVAYAIAHSPLVKTAFFACDPNLGRILAAIGYAGITDLDVNQIQVFLDQTLIAEKGGRAISYEEAQGQAILKQSDITIRVVLHRGEQTGHVWTCDLSYDYVKINAEYRT
jgi:glutamate N-acetyltransferase/amino-acid N-acetyltransferase